MQRYIDANKIKFSGESFNDTDGDALVSLSGVRRAIEQTPTADVVEVVRCKDCKRFMPYEGEEHKGDCEEFSELNCCVYEDDFCSFGERKARA